MARQAVGLCDAACMDSLPAFNQALHDEVAQAQGLIPASDDEHDFQYGEEVQRCTRCRHPHSQWAGGPCPGAPQDWGPGQYV